VIEEEDSFTDHLKVRGDYNIAVGKMISTDQSWG
jgi:hypothetical protein